jgi:NhaP-type Na+/H+ or K+/H+ antiporter
VHNDLLVGLAMVLILGIFAQWVAWRIRLPSILLLLLLGLFAGPITGILDVDALVGDLIFPIVSLSVAVILFEGGMSLRWSDIRGSGGIVRNLVSIGVVVTWLLTALAAYFLLNLDVALSMLLGATLVVTGPTVIIPLLQQIRPSGRVGSILRWEGIVIDPVGAILAVLVFEEILVTDLQSGITVAVVTLVQTLVLGLVIGIVTANIMVELYRRYWVPDALQNAATLMFVVAGFSVSNLIQPESGLLTVTVMGMTMTNQKRFDVSHIIEFKESLQILLISSLFILLSARVQPESLAVINFNTIVFIVFMIVVERPLAVWLSTIGFGLSWRERVFLAWMAPRGIVAASVASIFALELARQGHEGARLLVPYTFATIIGTVAWYSLTAGFVARRLGISEANPQGIIMVGAHDWARDLATCIHNLDVRVLVVDTNQNNIEIAQRRGLETYHGNILSEVAMDEINLGGIGRLLAMTSNDEVNALASEHLTSTLGVQSVYVLPRDRMADGSPSISRRLGGICLFKPTMTFNTITELYNQGYEIRTIPITSENQQEWSTSENSILPFVVQTNQNDLLIWSEIDTPRLQAGDKLVAMVPPPTE